MSTPQLVYFFGRGRAEIIRIVLAASNIKFDEVHLKTRQQFLDIKQELTFAQLPLLRINGKSLVQTGAIVRHLARLYNLCGKNEDDKTLVDVYFEGTRDLYASFLPVGFYFQPNNFKEKTVKAVTKYLPIYDQLLKKNGSNGHLVGNYLTIADLGLLEALLYAKDYYEESDFDAYEEIKKFLSKMSQQPFFEKYMKEIRKAPNSDEYVSDVKTVLAF